MPNATTRLSARIRHTEIRAGFTASAETQTEGKRKEEKGEDHE
ncbi:MAG TPA: hypothetical protein VIM99_01735 [Blastocatellia bacterium]